jgi:hypothetical protein
MYDLETRTLMTVAILIVLYRSLTCVPGDSHKNAKYKASCSETVVFMLHGMPRFFFKELDISCGNYGNLRSGITFEIKLQK